MNRAFSATLLGSRESLGRCPRLAVNAAPLALKAHRKPEGLVLRTNQTGRFCITSFLQLRESDLYGRGRIAQLSFFFLRRSFFVLLVAGIVDPGRRDHRSQLQNE